MKKIAGALLFSLTLATTAWAETEKETGFYLGLTAGSDMIDVEGIEDASGAGMMAGWRFNKNFAVEFAGHASDADTMLAGCTLEIDTVALYLTARSSGQVYGKGRVGALSETITPRDTCATLPEETESGLSAGLGGGVRFGKAAIEVEYTLVEADVNRLSASILYNF